MGKGSGTVVGGRVGMKIAPDLVSSLARGRTVILVSGTNGKTTTTAMIVAGWGGAVTTNETGANMPAGHVAALVESKVGHVALEVDEAWLADTLASTRPSVVVLLNLSRDQLDRANEVRHLAERWRKALEAHHDDNLVVVANANDPLVVYAGEVRANTVWCDVPTSWLADALSCPKCTLAISHVDEAVRRVNAIQSVVGRFSVRRWHGHVLRLLLAKNPSGFAAMMATLAEDGSDVWVAINARVADGHDPSWLYDVPFEMLRGHRVYCFGDRRLDLATRLDYGQVDFVVVDNDELVPTSKETISLLANYTAFSDWLARSEP
jgi:UDP-N-acetylmuramyl tripeptide synthase